MKIRLLSPLAVDICDLQEHDLIKLVVFYPMVILDPMSDTDAGCSRRAWVPPYCQAARGIGWRAVISSMDVCMMGLCV